MSSIPPPPTKYIQVDGVMRLNPEYQRWKERTGGVSEPSSFASAPSVVSSVAIPVVSTMADYSSLHDAIVVTDATAVAPTLAESTSATMEIMQEEEISLGMGVAAGDNAFEKLTQLLAKYEVPIGLVNKLFLLEEFAVLEFIVDDSESMTLASNTEYPHGTPQTRWEEAQNRLIALMEILTHVPIQTIDIRFLNRPDHITATRNGRDPTSFCAHLESRIRAVFRVPPSGSTPIRERLEESFQRGRGQAVARYILCDGAPNGGPHGRRHVLRLLQQRPDPARNPITLMSCTDETAQVEWMKDAEEVVPYCSEYDDYLEERAEVLKDQGDALPFTLGFYLVGQLVGAMCPDDLDAMDESVPFTKTTLDNLLGIQHNNATYQHYFSCFVAAQQKRKVHTNRAGQAKPSDRLKKSFPWKNHYAAFVSTPWAKDIPAVKEYQRELEKMDALWDKQAVNAKAPSSEPTVEL